MKLESKTGTELASMQIDAPSKNALQTKIAIGDIVVNAPETQCNIEKRGDNLVAHIRIPGMVNFNMVVEPADVKAMKSLMSKDVLKFMMKAFF